MEDMKVLEIGGGSFEIADAEAREYIAQLQTDVVALRAAVGSPLQASTKAGMTDHSKVYVYTGSESGMTAGNWYYWNGLDYVSGGTYNSTALETDTTMSVSGMAPDSKVVGDNIADLKNTIGDLNDLATTDKSDLVSAINEAASTGGGGGQPVPVTLANQMTDTEAVYLYLGSEAGYDYGYVYAYLGNAWTKTNLYGKGADGYSPTVSVTQTDSGATISVTDGTGTTTATVENGTATDAQVAAWLDDHPEATTTVQNRAITENKLSDSVYEKLGWEREAEDRSLNLVEYAEAKLCKWGNGNPSYPTTGVDCIEFKFDMEEIRPHIPADLSPATDMMVFGTDDDTTYGTRYLIYHNETKWSADTYSNKTGLRLIPNYSDLDSVYLYVFKSNGDAPTTDDIETVTSHVVAKVHDFNYCDHISSDYYVKPTYSLVSQKWTFFLYPDDANIITVKNVDTTQENVSIKVFNSSFAEVSSINNPALKTLYDANTYIRYTGLADAPTMGWGDVTFSIPSNESVVFWSIGTGLISENTVIDYHKEGIKDDTLNEKDIAFLKEKYSELGEFKGVFNRIINRGKLNVFNPRDFSPIMSSKDFSYYDILSNGENGDWYIYRGYNDLQIKNLQASYGDIIYRKSSTAYLPIKNPIKWGNYETVGQSSYDVVIVGSGAGGIGAAYALRNSGLKVLLVDKMQDLGGTHTQAGLSVMLSSPVGDWFKTVCKDAYDCSAMRFVTYSSAFDSKTTFDEKWDASLATNPTTKATLQLSINRSWFSRRYHEDITNGGIEIRYQRKFVSHNDVGGRISSLYFDNLITGGREKVFTKCVIDCTGDVYVGRYNRTLDTDFFIGSDPYSMYNESATSNISEGSHYDINTPEIMYRYCSYSSNGKINNDFVAFTNADEYADKDSDFKTMDGVDNGINSTYGENYFANPNGLSNNPFSNGSYFPDYSMIVSPDYHCGITKQMLVDYGEERVHEIARDYAKAHYLIKYKTTSRYFGGEFPLLAIREGYRMNCEYMVTQADLEDTITSENYESKNIIALSSWYADIHQNTTVNTNAINNTFKNGIPYLAMVPTSYKNLLIACRGYGASHVGLSGIRLIKTMMSLGRAAGFAAKQYVDDNLMDMRNVDVEQLQDDLDIGGLIEYLEENVYPDYE